MAPDDRTQPAWLKAYLRSDWLVNRGIQAARGVFEGFWLAALSPAQLARLDEHYYDTTAKYLDEQYNRSGLKPWEETIVFGHFPAGASVAVLGAGGGREVLALLAQGYDAWGYEPNARLANFGSALTSADGHGERVLACARDVWPAGSRRFDAVLVGWGAYMLISSAAQRVALLTDAAAASGGGPVAISYFHRPHDSVRFRASAAVGSAVSRVRGGREVLIGDAVSPTYVHYFTRRQIAHELSSAGLAPVLSGVDAEYGWAVATARADGPTTTEEEHHHG